MTRRRGSTGGRAKPKGPREATGGFPTLGDGTPYRAGMTVQAIDPVGGMTWRGRLQWTQRNDGEPWRGIVSWDECLDDPAADAGGHYRPQATRLLADLAASPAPVT